MSKYIPNTWIVVEIESKSLGKIQKVLAGWSGGYLDGDSWRLSSGITDIKETDDEWIITNESGSIYHCRKTARRFNTMTGSVFDYYKNRAEEQDAGFTIQIIDLPRKVF
jgi:hypothetical protein